MSTRLGAFALVLGLPFAAAAAGLDPTFGTGGIVTTSFVQGSVQASKLVQEPDGRLVVVGTLGTAPSEQIVLARYSVDGALDPAFGIGGLVVTDPVSVPNGVAFVFDAAVQTDGNILVGGLSGIGEGFLVRYRYADGGLDTTFGTGGVAIDPNASAGSFALALQSTGKIVAVTTSGGSNVVARYDTLGNPDVSFANKGTSAGLGDAQAFFVGMAVRASDDSIFVGSVDSQTLNFLVFHLLADGTLDAGFGSGGQVTTGFPGATVVLGAAVAPLPDGRLIAVGSNIVTELLAARYLGDGSLDASFGTGGRATTPLLAFVGFVPGVALQPDDKLVVATFGGAGGVTVLRYDTVGAPDPTFGAGGMLSGGDVSLEAPFYKGASLVLQQSGKPVVAGSSCPGGGNCAFALLRFVPGAGATCGNGTIDAGEQCDDGARNGTASSCCSTSCTLITEGARCASFVVPPTVTVPERRIGSAAIPIGVTLPPREQPSTWNFQAAGFAGVGMQRAVGGPAGLAQVTKTVRKTWRGRKSDHKVNLQLNAAGKRLLKKNKSLRVTVQQQLREKPGKSGTPGQSLVTQLTTVMQAQ